MNLAIVKLGGSIATDPDALASAQVAVDVLARLAHELLAWRGGLIVVHGTGAVGKPAALRHGFAATGIIDAPQRAIALRVKNDLHTMTARVIDTLLRGGLPAITCAIEPYLEEDPAAARLRAHLGDGLVPVLHGDMVRMADGGYRVLSSDEIVARLAQRLAPRHALFVTDVDGVLGRDEHGTEFLLPRLAAGDLARVSRRASDADDVSRGMTGKVGYAMLAAASSEACHIVNGRVPGRVGALLRGEIVPATAIVGER